MPLTSGSTPHERQHLITLSQSRSAISLVLDRLPQYSRQCRGQTSDQAAIAPIGAEYAPRKTSARLHQYGQSYHPAVSLSLRRAIRTAQITIAGRGTANVPKSRFLSLEAFGRRPACTWRGRWAGIRNPSQKRPVGAIHGSSTPQSHRERGHWRTVDMGQCQRLRSTKVLQRPPKARAQI
jgi:hypothetical protein